MFTAGTSSADTLAAHVALSWHKQGRNQGLEISATSKV